jgi:hypothetical protein
MTSGDTKASGLRPTRRTVVKGAAWAVPAVMVASSAPAAAASPGVVTLQGRDCKLPGSSAAPFTDGAVYLATIQNTFNTPINVEITSFTRGAATQLGGTITVVKLSSLPAGNCCVGLGNTFTVPENSSGTYAIITANWGSSGSGALSVEYTVNDVPQPPATGGEGALNPIPGGNCGTGGSCTDLTVAQRLCVTKATGAEGCTTGDCS